MLSEAKMGAVDKLAPFEQTELHRVETMKRIAPALIGLEGFCRQKGLDDVAARIEEAIIIIEIELTSQEHQRTLP